MADDIFFTDDELKNDFKIAESQQYVQEEEQQEQRQMQEYRPLTDKEKLFIQYYSESLNKSQAYRKAFADELKAKDTGLIYKANRLLERPEIKKQVNDIIQRNLDADVARSPSILLKQIERYLDLDPADYYHDDGSIVPLSELTPEQRMLISNVQKQISAKTGGVVLSYELPSKVNLLSKLSDLVKFVAQVRAATGETGESSDEVAAKRDAIFGGNFSENSTVVPAERKKKLGRPKKYVKIDDLPESLRDAIVEEIAYVKESSQDEDAINN